MNGALADYRLIWRTAIAPSTLRKVLWGLCTIFAVFGGAVAYHAGGGMFTPPAILLVFLPAVILALLYWLDFAAGAVRQLTPANAKLVPRLRVRAIQVVGAYWIVATLLIALVTGLAFGHAPLWLAAAAMWLAGSAMSRIGLSHGIGVQFMPYLLLVLPGAVVRSLQEFAATPVGIVACSAVVGLVAWHARRVMFPSGDRHFDQRAALEKGLKKAADRVAGFAPDGSTQVRGIYAACLARVSRGRTASGEVLLHAFGPGGHWTNSATIIAAITVILVVLRMFLAHAANDSQEAIAFVGGFVVMPLLVLFAMGPQRLIERACATAGEQALLRMTPVIRDMRIHNRVLASALFRRALIEWAMVTLCLVGVTVGTGARWDITLLQLTVCCLALPITTTVLRDYARAPKASWMSRFLAPAVLLLVALVVYLTALRTSPAMVSAIAITLSVAVTIVVAMVRGRAMVQAPLSFPTGRLAV